MLKNIIKKIIYGYKASSDSYISYLKIRGISVGENCFIFHPKVTTIDVLNPHLLSIGNNVKITGPTTILTHDYSTCVLNHLDNMIYGKQRKTVIGNNVFLGWGSTILAGAEIGNNTVIGANTVISGKIDSNSVYAGNPARKICSIDEYRKKIISNQIKEAKEIYLMYKNNHNEIPPKELFHEYFYLFCDDISDLSKTFLKKLDEEKIMFVNQKAYFSCFEEFCEYCEADEND